MRTRHIVIIGLAFAVLAAACGTEADTTTTEQATTTAVPSEPIKIGIIADLSMPSASQTPGLSDRLPFSLDCAFSQ